ncbi:hypothetical protein [Candidatus Enterococcus clewellii]|uniref:Uncharacterized protein n=2 Tax=Candidatus Enterococcus clewellii TaxID=1834193 RepID=A0AAQ3VXS6_9ENTE
MNSEGIEYFIACLNEKFNEENEYEKFVNFLETGLFNHKKIVHADGSPKFGGLIHKFVLCNKIPEQAQSSDFENELIKIQDQFIEENYNVFKNVTFYWNELGNLEQGFNYYGRTIITPDQASEMLQAVYVFLEEDESEQAEYFIGKDWDKLEKILKTAIAKKKMILHFGI